ncbi:coproporphyrinogen oxidase, putative chloroplast precursor [Tribonema minus]|uniref:Coproporphyrinogen oxidase, putative chloroplast n=1 Tax=Tribonema minus TaxID=303371 RepID=A0A835Z568_9STRA|nr:coproporphyrinogen oxidase, putative chloroplast precursor [Tribonema minus]
MVSQILAQSEGSDDFQSFAQFIVDTQATICSQAEEADASGATFCVDRWERGEGSRGFGITRVLEGGRLLEKAAASVSIIHGTLTADRAKAMTGRGREGIDANGGQPYSAAALSLVFHSRSPLVPTFRADVRLFEVAGQRWYGGGADLTPYYLTDGDIIAFHRLYRAICERHGTTEDYVRFKGWADKYFYIPMRGEHRGVGGIFFDDLETMGPNTEGSSGGAANVGAFVRDVAEAFMPSFLPLAAERGTEPYTEEQRQWQLLRRGRYLEFNLLYDRGVKFGLTGGGRVESIMVSAPPLIAWKYTGTDQASGAALSAPQKRLLAVLKQPLDWANMGTV